MRIDIEVAGWRLYLDLSQKDAPAPAAEQAPTQLATPMRTSGFAYPAAGLSEAAYATNSTTDT